MTKDRIGNEIKDGDKVVCISTLESFTLKIAHVYIVSNSGVINALLLEGDSHQYMGWRFIKALSFTEAMTLLDEYTSKKERELNDLSRQISESRRKMNAALNSLASPEE